MRLYPLLACLMLATPPVHAEGVAIDPTCRAAAERIAGLTYKTAKDEGKTINPEAATLEGRERIVSSMASRMSAESPQSCGLLLVLPESSMEALLRASRQP